MSAFFSFKAVLKKERKKSYNNGQNMIIEKGLLGVIAIKPDNSFYIIVKGKEYNINPKCYSCKGKTNVYYQVLDKNLQRILYIRSSFIDQELYRYNFLPFFVGVICKGNLIRDKYTKCIYFDIKKTISHLEPLLFAEEYSLQQDIMNNFRLNYKEYKQKRLELISKDLNGT